MTNFIYDNTSLPATKTDLNAVPMGLDANYMAANDYNKIAAALTDIQGFCRSANWLGLTSNSSDPAPSGITNYAYLKNDGFLYYNVGGTTNSLAINPAGSVAIQVATSFGGNFAKQNNWTPSGYGAATKVITITSQDGSTQQLSGLTGGIDGRIVTIVKATGNTNSLSISLEDSASTANNRFQGITTQWYGGTTASSITFVYAGSINRWVVMATAGGAAG